MKKFSFILMFILTFFLFSSNIHASEVISNCGNIPVKVGTMTRFVFNLIKYAVPVIIIVMGSIDVVKYIVGSDNDMLSKALKNFSKKLIAGVLVFLLMFIFQTVVKAFSKDGNISECISCFLVNKDYCTYMDEDDDEEPDNVTDGVKDNQDDFEQSSGSDNSSDSNSDNTSDNASSINIFIGDSRFNGMSQQVGILSNEKYVAQDSKGYDWFINTAISAVNNYISSTNGTYNIIINLGVNDMGNINSYISKYTSLANNDWKKHKIVIVSVNPVNDALAQKKGYKVIDSSVVNFNNKMKNITSKASNISYCDTYSNIKNNFKTSDGVHYTKETYKNIHDYIVNHCL